MTKRLQLALLGGAVLGIICIVRANLRSGRPLLPTFCICSLVQSRHYGIGDWELPGSPQTKSEPASWSDPGTLGVIRFYSSTGFKDPISFLAGIVYGVILEAWLSRTEKQS